MTRQDHHQRSQDSHVEEIDAKLRSTSQADESVSSQKQAQEKKQSTFKAICLSTDEFKQALLKYASRYAKSDKPFCLVGVELSNYKTLSAKSKEEDLRHLRNMFIRVTAENAREADRICTPADSMLLLLLPETHEQGANQAIKRITKSLASRTRPVTQIKPVFRFQLSSSDETGADLEEMLSGVGCTLDEHGQLTAKAQARVSSRLGSLDSWKSRYVALDETVSRETEYKQFRATITNMRDSWNQCDVRLAKIDLNESLENSPELYEILVKRARSLQSSEHPGLEPLHDFYIDVDSTLYLVVKEEVGSRLFHDSHVNRLSNEKLLQFCLDMVSILIQAQSMVPGLHLPFEHSMFCISEDGERLFVSDFQPGYLVSFSEKPTTESENLDTLVQFITALCAGREDRTSNELLHLANQIGTKEGATLGKLHKVRSSLKKLAERFAEEASEV